LMEVPIVYVLNVDFSQKNAHLQMLLSLVKQIIWLQLYQVKFIAWH